MNRTIRFFLAGLTVVFLLCGTAQSPAASTLPLTLEQQVAYSTAVFRGTVLGLESFRDANDNLIYTRTTLRVDEPVKGIFPATVRVVHRGGRVGNRDEFFGLSPRFNPGGEYLVFVVRRDDGQLTCTQGTTSAMPLEREKGAKRSAVLIPAHQALVDAARALARREAAAGSDVTDQAGGTTKAVTGLLATNGVSSRFTQQDRGEPIPYLIDAANLPAGITLAQATNAVRQALNAWTAVTSLKFQFEGFQNFGAGADTLDIEDGRLRIQLHDNFNSISTTNVLGIGGRQGNSAELLPIVSWDLGGSVGTNDFMQSAYGFVVLEGTNAALQDPQTLAEVLCHEIGHALSMAHSTETPTTNPTLTNSIMFYQAHADGRGATLGAYDPPVIQQAYPSNNTPPWSYDRVMDIATIQVGAPNLPGINEIEMRGYDLQTTNLTFTFTNIDVGSGAFSVAGKLLKFAPNAPWNGPRVDPATTEYYDYIAARFSDGTNASPVILVRIISLNPETVFSGVIDGIPNNWMITYFGNSNPNSGTKHKATDDFDGDGLINLQEYRAGMNPTDPASAQRLTLVTPNTVQFQAMPYELYELHASTNLTNWVRAMNPLVPTTATGTFSGFTNTTPCRFFRVVKVP